MAIKFSVFGLISVISLLIAAPAQTRAGQRAAIDQSRAALVIIDIQNFYFEGGKVPLTGSIEASLQAKKLLAAFRAKKGSIIHVKHVPANPAGLESDPAYAIHPNVAPAAGEKVLVKHYANAFRETELREVLKQRGIQQLVICGMQTQMCVEAATRAAADFGFTVIVAHDACATRPLNFNGVDVPAALVHAAALATMNGTYANVLKTADVLAALR